MTLPNGLNIDDVAVHVSGGRRWATLPGKPMIDGEGRALRDERGKVKYALPIRWSTHSLASEFGRRVIELVHQQHPSALDEGGGL